jgi:long-chain acyl-CoA synthetase
MTTNVPSRFLQLARLRPQMPLVQRSNGGIVEHLSAAHMRYDVLVAAAKLIERGVLPGDRVMVLVPTSYDHAVIDLAVLCVGAIAVPVYDTDSVEQLEWILTDADPVLAVCDPARRVDLDAALGAAAGRCLTVTPSEVLGTADDVDERPVLERVEKINSDDAACIVYTSGTTGRSKGCVLTHGNLSFAVDAASASLPDLFGEGASTVLFLPLAHVFARVVNYGCLSLGVQVAYSDPTRMAEDVRRFNPTWMTVVPRVLEKVYASARDNTSGGKRRIFDAAAATAIAVSERRDQGRSSGMLAPAHALFDRLVYSKLRTALGGAITHVISGGAPLDPRLDRFFSGAGITVLEGYGLTETTAAHTANRPARKKAGTVGLPIEGVAVRVRDGEIELSGPNIFAGYWRNDAATVEVFDGRWLRTGDLGEIDTEGFLTVTGRKKDLIVTAGGKNVQPSGLEEVVVRHPAVSQCVVVGDRRPFVAALVALSPQWVEQTADELGVTPDDVAFHARISTAVSEAVELANASVSRAESIRAWRLLPGEMSVESGELTPTLKTKRSVVAERFKDLIEDIYTATSES